MRRHFSRAKAFAEGDAVARLHGEVGNRKRDFIEALFQYWHKQQVDQNSAY